MDPSKVDSVMSWPTPHSIKDFKRFFGLSGYYRRFISNYGSIAKSRIELFKKSEWNWSQAVEKALQTLKCALSIAPVLHLSNF